MPPRGGLNYPIPKKPLSTVGNGLDRSEKRTILNVPRYPTSPHPRHCETVRTLSWQSASLVWSVQSGEWSECAASRLI